MDKPSAFMLPAGTVCKRNGIPFVLQHATQIECAPGVWPLIKGDPPDEIEMATDSPVKPLKPSEGAAVDVAPLSVVDVLELCKRELAFIGGCTLTDMPDVPLSPETSWTMDFTWLFGVIDDALDLLVGADRRTAPECTDGNTSPPTRQISGRSKYVPAHLDSRMAEEDRS